MFRIRRRLNRRGRPRESGRLPMVVWGVSPGCRIGNLELGDGPASLPVDPQPDPAAAAGERLQRAIARDALSVQDYKTAYQAVQRVLVLEPTAPDKKQLTTLLKQLKPLIGITTVNGSTGSP